MRIVRHAALMLCAFAIGLVVMRSLRSGRITADRQDTSAIDSLGETGGSELVLVYIGRSTCAWCGHPDLPGLVKAAATNLRNEAAHRGAVFTTLGLSVDRLPAPGLKHLRQIFDFDAVASGGSWTGVVTGTLLWRDNAGEAATPQLMVLERHLVHVVGGGSAVSYMVDEERVLASKSGLLEIERWTQAGTPLPRILSATAAE